MRPGQNPPSGRYRQANDTQRSRQQSAAVIQQPSGIAPVTQRSGKNQHWVHRRWARPYFVHRSFFEFADSSSRNKWPKAKNIPPRCAPWSSNGPESFRGWRDRVAYDESTYLDSFKRRGSPLAANLQLTLAHAA